MKKLIAKLIGGVTALAMAIGVGVAVMNNKVEKVDATETSATLAAGSNSAAIKVNYNSAGVPASNNGVRISTSKNLGSATFTIAKNSTSFGFSAVGWSGKSVTATISASVGTPSASSADLTANDAASGNIGSGATVEITGDDEDIKKSFTITGVTGSSTITLSTSSSEKRAIFWDAWYEVPASKVLSSIALSGTYPTSFTQGDTFSHAGMTVTATYGDSTTADVTSSAEFSGYDMSTSGDQTVTVTYVENAVTKTATYDITVAAATMYSVGGTITNGSLSSTASVRQGNTLNINIAANEKYSLPASLSSVTMGGNALVSGSGYTYNPETGAFSIASVTGNVVINATCTKTRGFWVDNPFTVAEAIAAIDANAGNTISEVYVTGIVSQVDSFNETYHSVTYWISDDGTTTNQFEV